MDARISKIQLNQKFDCKIKTFEFSYLHVIYPFSMPLSSATLDISLFHLLVGFPMALSLFLFDLDSSHIAGRNNHVNMFRFERSVAGAVSPNVNFITSP
ncbi:hypothetical protein R6Q59_002061 [Mikania micrantha]